jgi:hypothetical protein
MLPESLGFLIFGLFDDARDVLKKVEQVFRNGSLDGGAPGEA